MTALQPPPQSSYRGYVRKLTGLDSVMHQILSTITYFALITVQFLQGKGRITQRFIKQVRLLVPTTLLLWTHPAAGHREWSGARKF
jgi:hypothetical protein